MPTIIKNGRNYSGTSVSLTQAEYDALPEITKMNGTTYFITDSEVVLNAEDVALDEGNLNDLAGSVATIETSPATANHEVGEYILWNGVLYTVTSAIATGENLVINSNISVRTIGDELTALNNGLSALEGIGDYSTTEKAIGTWIDGRTVYRRVVELDSDISISPTSWTAINALPLSTYKHILNIMGYTSTLNNMWNLLTATDSGLYVRLLVARDGQSVNVRTLVVEYLKD